MERSSRALRATPPVKQIKVPDTILRPHVFAFPSSATTFPELHHINQSVSKPRADAQYTLEIQPNTVALVKKSIKYV